MFLHKTLYIISNEVLVLIFKNLEQHSNVGEIKKLKYLLRDEKRENEPR